MPNSSTKVEKARLRETLRLRRKSLEGKDSRSERIWDHLQTLPAFRTARTIMAYLQLPEEVRTEHVVQWAMSPPNRLVIPYCRADGLELFRVESLTELVPGVFHVLEPAAEWKSDAGRRVSAEELDIVLVPGVGFDRHGNRLGYGKAYYDIFLKTVPSVVPKIGLAFDCQVVEAIPVEVHDRRVDLVVTESGILSPLPAIRSR